MPLETFDDGGVRDTEGLFQFAERYWGGVAGMPRESEFSDAEFRVCYVSYDTIDS